LRGRAAGFGRAGAAAGAGGSSASRARTALRGRADCRGGAGGASSAARAGADALRARGAGFAALGLAALRLGWGLARAIAERALRERLRRSISLEHKSTKKSLQQLLLCSTQYKKMFRYKTRAVRIRTRTRT